MVSLLPIREGPVAVHVQLLLFNLLPHHEMWFFASILDLAPLRNKRLRRVQYCYFGPLVSTKKEQRWN